MNATSLISALGLLLAGCTPPLEPITPVTETPKPGVGVTTAITSYDFCIVGRPIHVRDRDKLTLATANEIIHHNELGKKMCGWKF